MAIQRISSDQISDGTVIAADIADGSVTGPKIGQNAINANNIVNGTITGVKIAANTITGDDIGQNAISANNISSGAIEQYQNLAGYSPFFRNRIINGDMRIDQRNAGAVVTVNGAAPYTVDRWFAEDATDGAFTVQQDSSSNTITGFSSSAKITVTTADTSLTATQYAVFTQRIEGFNTADLMWGTANAKTITLSFYVRSSNTGTFGGVLSNSAENYSYPFTYSISATDTWEQKSVTVTGPTAGTWIGATNGKGMIVTFALGSGSTYVGTAGAWAAADYRGGATGQTNIIGTLNATWYITGVQLEVGSVATPFERRPYGTEILLCQRYFQRAGQYATYAGRTGSTTQVRFGIPLNTYLRATPTVSNSGEGFAYSGGARVNGSGGSVTPETYTNSTNLTAVVSGFTGLTDDRIYNLNFGSGDLFISAEL